MNTLTLLASALVHQSALEPAGAQAETIARLWLLFLRVTAGVYVLVMAALLIGLLRRRRNPPAAPTPRSAHSAVTVATVLTVVTLFALLVASILAGHALAGGPDQPHALHVTLTGRQWWWQVEYDDPVPSRRITSANEITVPVGVPVAIHLRSRDVIHSFWVPGLNGKRDLIPGHDGVLTIQATRPGVFRGQCAEFCGVQHAKMALWVNALPPSDYARWTAAQRQVPTPPATPAQRDGQQVFLRSPCPLCHNVGGTDASGRTAPDLTHFASRRSLGAGALPNTRASLAGWIADPQQAKPGCQMPAMPLPRAELDSLLDYLGSLR